MSGIVRNPILIPFTLGSRTLDKIYLDTTFASSDETYRQFTPKADGINQLLEKVLRYPANTVFHLHAWTFGYEDVWIALSCALQSQVSHSRHITKGMLISTDPC